MGIFWSSKEKTPIGWKQRLKHLVTNYWHGVCGFILGLICIPPFDDKPGTPAIQAKCIYLMIIIYFILQPVPPPITATIPVFLLPLCNIVGSKRLCLLFFDDNTCHYILGSMMLVLLNNSGFHRRMLVHFICLGKKWSPMRFMLFSSIGAFLMSMFSNRLIVMNTLMELVSQPLQDYADSASDSGPNYKLMKNILICCIGCACSIGSTASIHSSTTIMLFKCIWHGGWNTVQFPDIFNYFQYMFFMIPLSITCQLLNVGFFCLLFKICFRKQPIPAATCTGLRTNFIAHKDKLAPMSEHEMLTVAFTVLYYIFLLFRYSYMLGGGWSKFGIVPLTKDLPYVGDCTVSAAFVLLLSILPKDWNFIKTFTAKKKSQMPPAKRPSAILYWKFADMNVNYGYIFLFGCGLCLDVALQETRYNQDLAEYFGSTLSTLGFELSVLLFLVFAAVFANLTVGAAAVVILLPFIKAMGSNIHNHPWPTKNYLGALGVGICASFGFMSSYKYTPNYYAKTVAKTKTLDMMKLGIGPVIINVIITWFFLMFFAPTVFDPTDEGIYAIAVISIKK